VAAAVCENTKVTSPMHDRQRAARLAESLEPVQARLARAAKFSQYRHASRLVLAHSDLAVEEKLLRGNPEFATLWNSRRRFLLSQPCTADLLQTELDLTRDVLSERNAKSYFAWYHRRWALDTLQPDQAVLRQELALCGKLLERDARNFNCWAHRNWVVDKLGADGGAQEAELATSRELIEKNFSNYSAWHLRARALRGARVEFEHEFELADNAFFTEPADQSAWMYFRWLISRPDVPHDALRAQVRVLQDLLGEEGDCKWPLLALLQLWSVLGDHDEAMADVCARLLLVDAPHANFYLYVRALCAKGQGSLAKRVLLV
jgi:geranylgeranyl transferase type-2 subunit alpha